MLQAAQFCLRSSELKQQGLGPVAVQAAELPLPAFLLSYEYHFP